MVLTVLSLQVPLGRRHRMIHISSRIAYARICIYHVIFTYNASVPWGQDPLGAALLTPRCISSCCNTESENIRQKTLGGKRIPVTSRYNLTGVSSSDGGPSLRLCYSGRACLPTLVSYGAREGGVRCLCFFQKGGHMLFYVRALL